MAAAVIVVALVCLGRPAWRAVVGTVEAVRGETTPIAVANAYLEAVFESGDDLGIDRCLCTEGRDDLLREARDLREQVKRQAVFDIKIESSDWRTTDSDGTVSALVNLQFTQIDPTTGNVVLVEGSPHEWRFHTRQERRVGGGWKVCRVDAPPLCGTYLRC
ncbi:hypothetical protein [Micromonospora eburnea]|uniref:hypothetical protein n=1 Tax=Micromonospora eburnea TaxID=227316 RepID=UPI000B860FFB|nr:hypothetical protein [Micromonospora eburnea]